ncbi:MAG: trypsin-like peptidase domain-containing protein [Coleofasciculaceae cyanobacterium RL_1_1]|nr:trypsin-like peptidase domain-containing protein [Coleofasciculaceae cyanobacterium RL_1_1]
MREIEVRDAPDDIQPLELNFDRPGILASMLIIGHPINGDPWTVVRGDINNNLERLQMTATIAAGNSGDPVLDENDQVVGMMLAVEVADAATSGFAVAYPLARLRSQLETWGVLWPDARIQALK